MKKFTFILTIIALLICAVLGASEDLTPDDGEIEAFNSEEAFDSDDFAEPPGEHRNLRRRGRRRRGRRRRKFKKWYKYHKPKYYYYPKKKYYYRTDFCRTHYWLPSCAPKTYKYWDWDSSSSSRSGKSRK